MGHILGTESHVSRATLVRLLLAMTTDIRDHEYGPSRPIFAFFAVLGQVENSISPWGKGPSQERSENLLSYDQGSIALEFCICSSSLAGVMQLSVRATLPNFAFLAVFCPVA